MHDRQRVELPSSPLIKNDKIMDNRLNREIVMRSIRAADIIRISYDGLELDYEGLHISRKKMQAFKEKIAEAVGDFMNKEKEI